MTMKQDAGQRVGVQEQHVTAPHKLASARDQHPPDRTVGAEKRIERNPCAVALVSARRTCSTDGERERGLLELTRKAAKASG